MSLKEFLLKPKNLALLGSTTYVTYKLYKFFSTPNVSADEGGAFMFKEPDASQIAAAATVVKKERYIQPEEPNVPILILVGTEYGLSHEVAKKLEETINAVQGFWARVVDMEEYEIIDFEQEQLVLVITSTYGDGVPPTTARPFFDYLESAQLSYPHLKFAVLALGDRSYPLYCAAGKAMDANFERFQCKRIRDRQEVDQEDWSIFDRWISQMASLIPKVEGLEQRANDYLYEKAKNSSLNQGKHNKKKPYSSRLVVKRKLTHGQDRDVFHFEFELGDSELKFIPGDALAILPDNPREEVLKVIKLLKASANQKVSTPTWHYQEGNDANPFKITLEHILTKCFDIHNVKPELLVLLRDNAKSASDKEALTALLAKGTSKSNEELHKFLYNHHLVDVLEKFPSARPALDDILAQLAKLLPRYYSIASSMAQDEKNVSLCVAVVKYQLHNSDRVGVASTHMADRMKLNDRVSIFVNNNPDFRLPEDPSTPIIMIGPGTGIAPFIAYIQQRIKDQATGENHLFFGCRKSTEDFLYKEELEAYQAAGQIKLHTAFSRETQSKVYVQNRLLENSQQIAELLEKGAHIYVCGDANAMAPQVHQTLTQIITKQLSISEAEAEQYLHRLEKQKRYQKDTWF